MDFLNQFTDQLGSVLGVSLVNILIALGVLIVGWLIALLISRVVRGLLNRTTIDERIGGWISGEGEGEGINVAKWISQGIFWLLMLLVFIAFFQILGMATVTNTLNDIFGQILAFLPNLLAAGVLVLVAWIIATALKFLVTRGLRALNVDQRLQRDMPEGRQRTSIAEAIGTAVYWLVFLLFLPAILDALQLGGLLAPVQGMINELLAFLPNLFAAGVILLVGWFAARIIRRVITSVLAAVGVDSLGERAGVSSRGRRLSDALGLVVYILILIPVIVAALNALQIAAVTEPAMNMLNGILVALPNIFAAGLVLFLTYLVARVVAGLVENLLQGVGFNDLMARIGWRTQTEAMETAEGETTMVRAGPSRVVAWVVVGIFMLFALVEAFNLLGFAQIATLFSGLIVFVGQVFLGLLIFGAGLYLANLAASAIKSSDMRNANLFAWVAEIGILLLAGAMALRQMGLANSIINLAFGLLLGAVAVAAALAFGLGGREVAANRLKEWMRSADTGVEPPPSIGGGIPTRPTPTGPSPTAPPLDVPGIAGRPGSEPEPPPRGGDRP